MKTFFSKILWFAPLLGLFLIDSLLPIDYFNHRVWESLVVMRPNQVLSGPFYPHRHLIKNEAASSIDFYNGVSVRKTNEWFTDRYGYRKKDPHRFINEIAVIGDSNIAGSGQTQETLFTEQLEELLGVGVYPLAPGGIESLFYAPLFRRNPPKILIVSFIERNIRLMGSYHESERTKLFEIAQFLKKGDLLWSGFLLSHRWILQTAVFIDRFFYKKTLAQYWKSQLFGLRDKSRASNSSAGARHLFFQGDIANQDFSDAVLESTAAIYKSYHEACKKRGIRFIFMPIPNKENIYWDELPQKTKPLFLMKLVERLRADGVEVVDLETAYKEQKAKKPDLLLYDPEEAHWNPFGCKIAASEMQKQIASREKNINRGFE